MRKAEKPVWLKNKSPAAITPRDLVSLRDEVGRRSAIIFSELVIKRPTLMEHERSWLFHLSQGAAILVSTHPAQVAQSAITHQRITCELADRLPAVIDLVGDVEGTMFAEILATAERYWASHLAEVEVVGRA